MTVNAVACSTCLASRVPPDVDCLKHDVVDEHTTVQLHGSPRLDADDLGATVEAMASLVAAIVRSNGASHKRPVPKLDARNSCGRAHPGASERKAPIDATLRDSNALHVAALNDDVRPGSDAVELDSLRRPYPEELQRPVHLARHKPHLPFKDRAGDGHGPLASPAIDDHVPDNPAPLRLRSVVRQSAYDRDPPS